MPYRLSLIPALVALLSARSIAQQAGPIHPPAKVPMAFNRLYDYRELTEQLRKLAEAHREIVRIASIGQSVEGRDIWCVTINNPKTGADDIKPAMYVDGNIHGNEVQAAEVALYLVWYLTEQYGRNPALTRLVDERAFYIVPTVNPDGRDYWFHGPNTTHSSRSGKRPHDDDRDGLVDEDGYDDLDGDGQVTQMRRKRPDGRYKISPEDPRLLVPAKPGEPGGYELLGAEGIDNDGDGRVNEDPPGGYDMNRNWPADWQPPHIQGGAGDYPLCWPETRAVADFLLGHPNIAGVMAFHNAAGMILRGPGHETRRDEYPAEDDRVVEAIGATGARMLPFYRNLVLYKDLYPVHGGLSTWTYEGLGIFSFTGELWNNEQLLGRAASGSTLERAVGATEQAGQLFANDRLLFGEIFRPWKPFRHPLYGDIEIGGFVKQSQRVPPPFLIEEMCHRNAAFVLYHADQLPRVAWDNLKAESIGPGIFAVTASIHNTRMIPTVSAHASQRKIGLPDFISLSGEGLEVLGGGPLVNPDTGEVEPVESRPQRLALDRGIPGESIRGVRWFVRGKGTAAIRYESQKGGILTRDLALE
jgi:hypothetical protein